jgi:UDP-GlcNAc:undecaprenyl-phosphate GlcNAc-1-phosphate transferase
MVWSQLTDHLQVLYGAVTALVIVLLLTPAVGRSARYLRLIERPREGERERPAIPRLGGLALFLGVLVPALAFLPLGGELRGVVLGAAVATTVGAIDDFRSLSWWQKLGGQAFAAAIPVGFGIYLHTFTFPFIGRQDVPVWAGASVTVLGIVAVMNMVNFLDGLDGLAAGVCAISGLTFAVIELSLGRIGAAVLAAIVSGACLGFLRHNFYPARIFMGDSGALLLGFTLATISVAKRLKSGQPIYVADARHLHHRFMRLGFSERRSVVYLWTWCATLALAALATRFAPPHHHGHWSTVNLLVDAAAGLAALAFSLYVVYLLEIVKLANRRPRRRDTASRAA